MIEIHHYVIHELEKQATSMDVNEKLSQGLAEINGFAFALVEKMHVAFKEDSSTKNTKFTDTNESPFQNTLKSYLQNECTSDDFLKFSKDSLIDLKNRIKGESLSVGGFYVFADYKFNEKKYILVGLLRKEDGFDTEFKNGVFVVKGIKNLNINKLAMGFRFNVDIYDNQIDDDRNYIALITTGKTISKYFRDWVSAKGLINNDANTKAFIEIITSIKKEEIPKRFNSKIEFWTSLYTFIEESDKYVKLEIVSAMYFDDKFFLISFANEKGIVIDNEFSCDMNRLKSLIEIRVKADGIDLKIPRNKINNEDISIDNGSVTIHSQEFAEEILQELILFQNG
ncbi:nucleoid-associated protein [Emticicia aquatilis]|nr:nucleoid-associated protein [Emticicia aquatilis]